MKRSHRTVLLGAGLTAAAVALDKVQRSAPDDPDRWLVVTVNRAPADV
ncbi:hypothetical protein [Streptomyces roseolus]